MNLITVSSITYANKAKRHLDRVGKKAYVIKTPHTLGLRGCGYCLEVSGDPYEIADILKSVGIKVTGVYIGNY